jgi:hypothetical protein
MSRIEPGRIGVALLPAREEPPQLSMLEQLLKDNLEPRFSWRSRQGGFYEPSWLSTSLAANLSIFDGMLFFEGILLPFPRREYETLWEKGVLIHNILDFKAVQDLSKKKLLQFAEYPVADWNLVQRLGSRLTEVLIRDRRTAVMNQVDSLRRTDLVRLIDIERWHSRATEEWSDPRRSVRGSEDFALSMLSRSSVLEETHDAAYCLLLGKSLDEHVTSALRYISKQLENVRREIDTTLIEESLLSSRLVNRTPFTLSWLLRQLPDSSSPSYLYDVIFTVRKSKSVSRFRNWLMDFDTAMKNGDLSRILKCREEVITTAQSLREEFGVRESQKNVILGYSSITRDAFEDVLSLLTLKPPVKAIGRLLRCLEKRIVARRQAPVLFMRQFAEAGIRAKDLRSELERCFGRKRYLKDLADDVYRSSVISDKNEIIIEQRAFHFTSAQTRRIVRRTLTEQQIDQATVRLAHEIVKDAKGDVTQISEILRELEAAKIFRHDLDPVARCPLCASLVALSKLDEHVSNKRCVDNNQHQKFDGVKRNHPKL